MRIFNKILKFSLVLWIISLTYGASTAPTDDIRLIRRNAGGATAAPTDDGIDEKIRCDAGALFLLMNSIDTDAFAAQHEVARSLFKYLRNFLLQEREYSFFPIASSNPIIVTEKLLKDSGEKEPFTRDIIGDDITALMNVFVGYSAACIHSAKTLTFSGTTVRTILLVGTPESENMRVGLLQALSIFGHFNIADNYPYPGSANPVKELSQGSTSTLNANRHQIPLSYFIISKISSHELSSTSPKGISSGIDIRARVCGISRVEFFKDPLVFLIDESGKGEGLGQRIAFVRDKLGQTKGDIVIIKRNVSKWTAHALKDDDLVGNATDAAIQHFYENPDSSNLNTIFKNLKSCYFNT